MTFDLGGDPLGGIGGMMGPPPGPPSHWLPYFSVADTDAAVTAATGTGGTLLAADGHPVRSDGVPHRSRRGRVRARRTGAEDLDLLQLLFAHSNCSARRIAARYLLKPRSSSWRVTVAAGTGPAPPRSRPSAIPTGRRNP